MKRLLFSVALCSLVAGCGNEWEMTKKNFKANYISLKREVVVYDSMCGKELWRFTGEVFLSDGSKPGNTSFVYTDKDGKCKKADFLGHMISVSLKEVD